MRLRELTIAGFRAFRLPQTIPLNANTVVIHGPNGSGKSSIVEAVEWLLFGDISRHRRAASPSEFAGEYLRNAHCSPTEPTFVEAKVLLDGRELTIRREYQSPRSLSRILVNGSAVKDLSTAGISTEWNARPILSQGEMKAFVDTEQRERYSEVAYILGLDILGEFRRSLMDLRKNMDRDATVRQAVRLRDARVEDLGQYEELESLRNAVESPPYNHQTFLDKLYSCVKSISGVKARSLNKCQRALKAERDRIVTSCPELAALNELKIPGEIIPTSEVLKSLQEVTKICDRLKSIAAQKLEMRQARFLKDGLELVSDSTCPFCLQETVTKARKEEIRHYLEIYERGLRLEEKLQGSLDSFSSQWGIVLQDLRSRVQIQVPVKKALDEATKVLGITPDTEALRKSHDVRLPELQRQVNELSEQIDRFNKSCAKLLDHQPDLSARELITVANTIRHKIEKVCAKVYQETADLAILKSRMLSSIPAMSPEMEKKIRVTIALESVVEHSGYIKLAGMYGNRCLGLEALQRKVEEFERERMEQMLGDLSADIRYYYDKLNPSEPVRFTQLAIKTPIQRQVRIEGESFGRNLNPVSCFSEAHVNCLGLSLYFCQRVKRNPQWQLFVLDDPIQSMDEQHAECLVDILREISRDKQLIVLTQQKAFCDVLDDVFQGQSYIKYTCGPYGKDGPQIEPDVDSIERNLELAKRFCRSGKDDRINKSAGSLRKAMEGIVKELLVQKYGVPRASLRSQRIQLKGRLRQLEGLGFNKDDIVDMRTILPIVDKPHHDDPNWDVHPQRIDRAVKILESICKKHKIGPFWVSRTVAGRVTKYLPKAGVAIVEVTQPFSLGENLLIEGTTTRTQMVLESMELNRKRITAAEPGTVVGIKVPDKVRRNDLVYKSEQ